MKAICAMCGAEYVPKNKRCNNRKYCDECRKRINRKYHKEYKEQQRAVQNSCLRGNDGLDRKLKEIAEYNKSHNTNYSYGQYTALKRLKKL